MPTLKEIQVQIKNLDDFESFLGRKEIRELPSILWEDEMVENIIQGTYNNGNGILVATNKRLIFVDKGFLYGIKVEDFAYEKISSIQYETGILFGKLTIYTSGNKAIVENVFKAKVRLFGDWVRSKISTEQFNEIKPSLKNSTEENLNTLNQLERLAKLRAEGVLTDKEFAAQKKKILGK